MLNPYPTFLRPRSKSHPAQSNAPGLSQPSQLPTSQQPVKTAKFLHDNCNIPPRPPRNPARLIPAGAILATRPSDDGGITRNSSDWEAEPSCYPSPITPTSDKCSPSPKFMPTNRLTTASPQPQFSTIDRTIMRELEHSMLARSSQFRLKNDKKHHPFRSDQVPYPRSYEHACVDCDVWETVFCEQFSGGLTWHVFDQPPTKVLDLGCGTGSWIIDCARKWKECHFVGLDIVPLHPDLGRSNLGKRINWVQANFLEPLPFPNEEFDFVHVKRIARGVPENKWDFLFEEITRVMKPGGAFEMLEEDLYLPGRLRDAGLNTPSSSVLTSDGTSSISDSGTQLTTASSTASKSKPKGFSVGRGGVGNIKRSRSHGSVGIEFHSHRSRSRARSTGRGGSGNIRSLPKAKRTDGSDRSSGIASQPSQPSKKRSKRSASTVIRSQPLFPHSHAQPTGGNKLCFPAPPPLPSLPPGSMPGTERPPTPPALFSPAAPTSRSSLRSLSFTAQLPPSKTIDGRMSESRPQSSFSGRGSSVCYPGSSVTAAPTVTVGPVRRDALATRFSADMSSAKAGKEKGKEKQAIQLDGTSMISRPRSSSYTLGGGEVQDIGKAGNYPERHRFHQPSGSRAENAKLMTMFGAFGGSPASYSLFSVATSASSQFSTPSLDLNRRSGLLTTPRVSHPNSHSDPWTSKLTFSNMSGSYPNATSYSSSVLSGPNHPSAPVNPRNHRLLETIYAETHASRFVNLQPLSLLENYLGSYFKDVRTHAPLIFTFPPPLIHPSLEVIIAPEIDEVDPDRMHDATYDHDRDSILSARFTLDGGHSYSDSVHSSPQKSDSDSDLDWIFTQVSPSQQSVPMGSNALPNSSRRGSHLVSAKELMSGASEYVIVDESRVSALGPRESIATAASKANATPSEYVEEGAPLDNLPSFLTLDMDERSSVSSDATQSKNNLREVSHLRTAQQVYVLPNKNIDMDLRTLSLHLNARVVEVMACAESMWEWVREFQRRENEKERGRTKKTGKRGGNMREPGWAGGFGFGMSASAGPKFLPTAIVDGRLGQDIQSELLQMTRDRFDEMMTWFQFDMSDSMSLGAAIHSCFGWQSFLPQRTDERAAFDLSCSRWETYEANKLQTYLGTDNGSVADERQDKDTVGGNEERQTVLPHVPKTPPNKRLCRTLRVFVAWKA